MDRPTLTQVLDLWVQRPTATLSSLRVGGGVPRLQIKSITDPGSELKLAKIILSDGKKLGGCDNGPAMDTGGSEAEAEGA